MLVRERNIWEVSCNKHVEAGADTMLLGYNCQGRVLWRDPGRQMNEALWTGGLEVKTSSAMETSGRQIDQVLWTRNKKSEC